MLSVLPAHYEQSVQKCYPSLYFSNKKSTDFNVFFRTQILKKFDTNLRTLPVKVAALPCEVRNWFTRSKRYCPPPKKKVDDFKYRIKLHTSSCFRTCCITETVKTYKWQSSALTSPPSFFYHVSIASSIMLWRHSAHVGINRRRNSSTSCTDT